MGISRLPGCAEWCHLTCTKAHSTFSDCETLLQHEYEELAVSLGTDHIKRRDLSNRLKSVRTTCPLFDTVQWISDLEKVYLKMWEVHCQGRGPRTFEI